MLPPELSLSHTPKVFISHSKTNRRRAARLRSRLVANGVEVWFDDWDVFVGHDLSDAVYDGVRACDFLAVILTRASISSTWVQREINAARKRELEEQKVILLPLLFERVALPAELQTTLYADFTVFERGFEKLMQIVGPTRGIGSTDATVLEAARRAFLQTGSGQIGLPHSTVTNFAAARLARSVAMPVSEAAKWSDDHATEPGGATINIVLELRSANLRIPITVNAERRIGALLSWILRLLSAPNTFSTAAATYFLTCNGRALELSATLTEEGIENGASVQVGCYTYAIE
jgi:TIR domain-containing protein